FILLGSPGRQIANETLTAATRRGHLRTGGPRMLLQVVPAVDIGLVPSTAGSRFGGSIMIKLSAGTERFLGQSVQAVQTSVVLCPNPLLNSPIIWLRERRQPRHDRIRLGRPRALL